MRGNDRTFYPMTVHRKDDKTLQDRADYFTLCWRIRNKVKDTISVAAALAQHKLWHYITE